MISQTEALNIIEKAISKTKDNSLSWVSLGRNKQLFKKPDELDYTTIAGECLTVLYDKSYYSSFMDGYIFIISYTCNLYVETSPQPYIHLNHAPEHLALYIQPENAATAQSIADTEDTSDVSIQLRRMYNLVVEKASNLNGFIEEFLNS